MKREKLFSFVWSCVLAFVVSFGAVGCIVTAFDMAVDMSTVALWCGAASVLCSLCYCLPLGLLPVSALALIGGFLWQQGALETSVESILYRLSRQYDRAYSWGILKLNYLTADDMEQQLWLVLCALGVLIAMGISWAVCRKKSALPGVIPAVLLLAACLVVTDTVPQTLYLFLLFFGMGMLLLTNTVRRQDEGRGNRLSTILCLPVALALLALFAAIPQQSYQAREMPRKLMDDLLENGIVAEIFGRATEVGTTGSSVDSSTVNLKTVGVRLESNAEIMQVLTDYNGTLYLRGRGLDSYDGETWTDSGTSTTELYWPAGNQVKNGGEVMITTRYAHRMLYLPYYVTSIDMNEVTRGVENTNKLTQYSFSCTAPFPEGSSTMELFRSSGDLGRYDLSDYLHLSESVQKWAVPLVQEITAGQSSAYGKALAIRDYVRNSAKYDTNTYRMPSGSDDFVRWFLEDSDTGYCVHFASAATVLLQAAGIPARYVTGYTVDAEAAHLSVVRAKDAHAWAEYWLPDYGWVVLEATPPDEADAVPTETTEVPATDPEQTQATQATEKAPQQTTDQPTVMPKTEPSALQQILWVFVSAAVAVGLVIAQRSVRLRLRRKRLQTGSMNAQALQHWQETVYLARLLGETPDKTLFAIAQKAKFSQHTITEEELRQFKAYLSAACGKLKKRSVFHQAYYRLILVIY